MANFNMYRMASFSHLLGSSTKIPMLIPKYYKQWADRMEDYLNWIDKDLWRCIISGNYRPGRLGQVGTAGSTATIVL